MGKKRFLKNAMLLNNLTYIDIFNRMKDIMLNLYVWENLPDTCDARMIEITLFERGYVLFFEDELMGLLSLPCTLDGSFDVYGNSIKRTAFSNYNNYTNKKSSIDSVICYNNFMRTPSCDTVMLYAQRLSDIKRTCDVNINLQKVSKIYRTTQEQKLSIENFILESSGNVPYILTTKDFLPEDAIVEDIDTPFKADKLMLIEKNIWNDFLTFCGIENTNTEKRERMVADEVYGNYGNIEMQRNTRLRCREDAAKQVNEMFGTNISVHFNSELVSMLNNPDMIMNFKNVSREKLTESEESVNE